MKITEEKENALFNRREIRGNLELEKTPSREEVVRIISSKFSSPEENIKIKSILK
jgi:ribosomal protein S24E